MAGKQNKSLSRQATQGAMFVIIITVHRRRLSISPSVGMSHARTRARSETHTHTHAHRELQELDASAVLASKKGMGALAMMGEQ
eukprot:1159553-Pelagomonas_calceolata.AAC.21